MIRRGSDGAARFFRCGLGWSTALSAKGDPLEAIDRLVPWESFRADIEMVALTPDEARKSNAGRKPFDAILMLRMLVLQSLYNLADEQVEYQVRDRLSFTRFLKLGIEDGIPDGTTLWLFREKLAKAGLIEKLFDRFDHHLERAWVKRRRRVGRSLGGMPTIVAVPRQRDTRARMTPSSVAKRRGLEEEASQEPAEGQGCPLDEEARQELLRLQEPRECGCRAQADPALCGERRGSSRQPGAGWALEQG